MIERTSQPSSEDDPYPATPGKNPRRLRPAPLVLGFGIGVAVALAAILAYAMLTRHNAPRLTESDFQAAVKRWETNGPASYDLDLELTGNRPGKIHVEVRDRKVVRMTRDGVEPIQERTWYYWSVPGQFDTIEQELEMARDPAASFKSSQATQMVIWARFDPKFGYPLSYDRQVLGTHYEIHWKVTRFQEPSEKKRTSGAWLRPAGASKLAVKSDASLPSPGANR
ncbi:MAG: DUF6174 domain-containing protein [Pirellulales bacterium]